MEEKSLNCIHRNDTIQIVRGIAILLVIGMHTPLAISDYEITNYYIVIYRSIINVPVWIYFFLAGMYSCTEGKIKKRFSKLIKPYLFYSIIYLIISFVRGKDFNFFSDIILGQSSCQMYFLLVLLQLALITPFVDKFCLDKYLGLLISFLITIIWITVFYAVTIINREQMSYYLLPFFGWLFPYILGINCKKKLCFARLSGAILTILLIISVIISCLGHLYLWNKFGLMNFSTTQMSFSNLLMFIILAIIIVKYKESDIKAPLLKFLGDNSFGIYLSHMLFLPIVYKVIIILTSNLFLVFLTLPILTVVMSLFYIFIMKNVLPHKLKSYIGVV